MKSEYRIKRDTKNEKEHNRRLVLNLFNLCSQELEQYATKSSLKLRLAFSRETEKKVYVTHLLQADADMVWDIIGENKGHFYICG